MSDPLIPWQLQLVGAGALLLLLGWVIHLLRRRQLALRDSLLWLLSTGAALIATAYPPVLQAVADALRIAVPSNALFALAFLYVLLNLLSATIAISANAARVRRVAQDCALLRAELEALRAEVVPGAAGAPRPEAPSAPVR